LHILVIASFYPSEIRPQTGIFFKAQVQALRKAGHQVGVIVAPRLWETLGHIRQYKRWDTLTHEDDVIYRMHRGWFPRIFPLICAGWHGYEGLKAFETYIAEQGRPDIIHAHNIFYAGYMAVRIARQHTIPTVLTEHSSNFILGRIFLPGQHIVVKHTLKQINAIFAVGRRLAETINRRYQPENPVSILHNVVDIDYFVPKSSDNSEFIFAAVGAMRSLKRFDLLITAFAKAFKGQPVKLYIGGDGQQLDNIRTLIGDLDVANQVELLGYLRHKDVLELFQKADAIVSSSDDETFGVTLIEAMSCGKPVIATRSGGPEDFVTDEVGLLVPRDDPDALSDALQTMLQNYESYDALRIREYCIEMFSEATIVHKLETIYQQLLEK
jgi:L-malate glycosyltransferase